MATGQAWAQSPTEPIASGKSPGLALGLSIGLPLAGYGMITASLLPDGSSGWAKASAVSGAMLALVGPAGGHFYANRVGRGLAFSGGRFLLLFLGGMAFGEGLKHGDTSEADYDKDIVRRSAIEMALCAAGILGLSIWESIDTYYTTKRDSGPALSLTPMMVNQRDGVSLAGVSLAGRF